VVVTTTSARAIPRVTEDAAAHRVNLRAEAAPPTRAVLALPRPDLAHLFEPARFEALRGHGLRALAREVGGLEGSAPVVDLEHEPDLLAALKRLGAQGVTHLALFGAAERPDFAREVWERFEGVVVMGADLGLRAALDADAACVALGEGLWRVDVGAAPPPAAQAILWRAPGGDHPQLGATPEGVPARPVAPSGHGRLGAGLGLLPVAALAGDADAEALRRAWAAFAPAEVLGEIALGLETALEAALAPAQPERPAAPTAIAVTGVDGSGKSTHVARLAAACAERGHPTLMFKLYRQGAFLECADALSASTALGAPLAAFRTSRLVKLFDSLRAVHATLLPALQAGDAVVLDRWCETHKVAAGAQLGWSMAHHGALAKLPRPAARAWLLVDAPTALARLEARGGGRTADEHPVGLEGYARGFDALAQGAGELRLDAAASEAENAARLSLCLPPPVLPEPVPRPLPKASPAAPARRLQARCEVWLGRLPGLPSLGDSWSRLRDQAGALTAGFEWEARLIATWLELIEQAPVHATLPFWPEVLARLYPDLHGLRILGQRIEAEVIVRGWSPLEPDTVDARPPAARRRFALRYTRVLEALAIERGWPRTDPATPLFQESP
jgi:thymidylate kinase